MKKLLALAAVLVGLVAAGLWSSRVCCTPAKAPTASSSPRSPVAPSDLVAAVKSAGNARDFVAGADMVSASRAMSGVTPINLEALSWLARTAYSAGDLDRAERFARETYDLSGTLLRRRGVDDETHLPIALGAAIEVLGQVAATRGARTDAMLFLQTEVAKHRDTTIAKRIQKNINLISLEGTKAPALDLSEFLGRRPDGIDALRGQVVLMFFWAHWCSDCKAQAPVLASLQAKYASEGLTIVAPTQRFGYVAGGEIALADEERLYIGHVREKYYPMLARAAIPLSAANHFRYGVSTTPTIVLVDRVGTIRLYHPGQMTEAELEPIVRGLLGDRPVSPSTSG